MRLLAFSTSAAAVRRLGANLGGETIVDMKSAYRRHFGGEPPACFDSLTSLLAGGDDALALARDVCERERERGDDESRHDAGSIVFHPPAGDRAKIICVTMNYGSHAAASGGKQSAEPYFFTKMPTTMTAHRAPVCLSKTSRQHDSEIELAVIIGRRGKYVARDDAFDHVAGYSIINDLSFRDRRTLPGEPDSERLHWYTLKNLDTAAPIGPWLVTRDEIPDPYDLGISLTLDNDPAMRQSGTTAGMTHRIEDLIHHASNGVTLEPGDVIATGTPHAIAFGAGRFLADGDIVRAEISKIGTLINPVRAET